VEGLLKGLAQVSANEHPHLETAFDLRLKVR